MILMVKTKPAVLFKKKSILLIMVFLIGCFICACGKEDSVAGESLVEDTEEGSVIHTNTYLGQRLFNWRNCRIHDNIF